MKTLTIPLNTITRIAELNKEYRDKYAQSEGFRSIDSDQFLKAINDPLREEMHNLINDLPLNQKQELSAVVLLGRGDFSDFDSAYKHSKGFDGETTAMYLEAKPLYKYIPDGIAALENEGISIND